MLFLKKQPPGRLIVLGFALVILLGTGLLLLPVSVRDDVQVSFIDALFTSTSAVCVTGLASVDPGTTLSSFGEVVLALLIQIGGLGITSIGVIFIIAAGGRMGIGKQRLLKESLNLSSGKGLMDVLKAVGFVTVSFELIGAVLSFVTFSADYSTGRAIGLSVFHSIASFNERR